MIIVITGAPGDGKTCFALSYVPELQRKTSVAGAELRAVYYSGIADLRLPWIEMEKPDEWYELPAGSIVVIDECQRLFRPRVQGGAVPRSVAELETHRHKGFDIVLITQNPMLIDVNIRRLVNVHLHVIRVFGTHRAVVHEWGEIKNDPTTTAAKQMSLKRFFEYPKSSFALYKSAEVHTHKARIPKRMYLLVVLPFLVIGLLWWAYVRVQSSGLVDTMKKGELAVVPGKGISHGEDLRSAQVKGDSSEGHVKTKLELLSERVPLLPGFPHTAPVYASITKPKVAPLPAACLYMASKGCRCYTQQATIVGDMPEDVCMQIVAKGYFVDFKDEGRIERSSDRGRGADVDTKGRSPVPAVGSGESVSMSRTGLSGRELVATSVGGVDVSQIGSPVVGAAAGALDSPVLERQQTVPLGSPFRAK